MQSQNPTDTQASTEYAQWNKAVGKAWRPDYGLLGRLATYSFEDEINRIAPQGLNEQDQRAADNFRNEILSLYKTVREKGGLTKEAAEYYDTYSGMSGASKKVRQIFNFDPGEGP